MDVQCTVFRLFAAGQRAFSWQNSVLGSPDPYRLPLRNHADMYTFFLRYTYGSSSFLHFFFYSSTELWNWNIQKSSTDCAASNCMMILVCVSCNSAYRYLRNTFFELFGKCIHFLLGKCTKAGWGQYIVGMYILLQIKFLNSA